MGRCRGGCIRSLRSVCSGGRGCHRVASETALAPRKLAAGETWSRRKTLAKDSWHGCSVGDVFAVLFGTQKKRSMDGDLLSLEDILEATMEPNMYGPMIRRLRLRVATILMNDTEV